MRRLILASIAVVSTSIFAQQFFGAPPQAPSPTSTKAPQVMSSSDFSKQVNSMNQQTEKRITQEVKDSMPKQPLYQLKPEEPTSPNSTVTSSVQAPPKMEKPPVPTTSAPPTTTSPPPAPSQVYTGFGGTAPAAPQPRTVPGPRSQPTQQGGSKPGWNIQY